MTLQLRHLSSLLMRKPLEARKRPAPSHAESSGPEVPGLSYYSAVEPAGAPRSCPAPLSREGQALDAMYGYYSAQS